MEKLSYILCCLRGSDSFCLTFKADQLKFLEAKYRYFFVKGYSFLFFSLKDGIFQISDISEIFEK